MTKTFLEFLENEEKNAPHKTYSTDVFRYDDNGEIRLRDSVLKFLVSAADQVDELVPIEGAFLIGKICSKNYDKKTPITMIILIDKNDINRVIHDRLLEVSANISKGLVADTMHPADIKIELVNGSDGAKKWINSQISCFDISSDKWKKEYEEPGDDIKIALNAIKKMEPVDLVFFDRANPIKSVLFKEYDKNSLEKIKEKIKNKLFDLTREANGKATTPSEKKLVKTMLSDSEIDGEKLELKFVSNEISEDIALNLLRQKYYYEILDLISAEKANQSIEAEFDSNLQQINKNNTTNEQIERKHISFNEFVLTEDKKHLKKLRNLAKLAQPGSAHRQSKSDKAKGHRNLGLEMRSNNRKRLRQLAAYRELTRSPQEQISDEFSCKSILQNAKDKPRGFWPLSIMQAKWVASVYHFDMPTKRDRIKRLSNMPMALFKPKRGGFFLVKDERLAGIT